MSWWNLVDTLKQKSESVVSAVSEFQSSLSQETAELITEVEHKHTGETLAEITKAVKEGKSLTDPATRPASSSSSSSPDTKPVSSSSSESESSTSEDESSSSSSRSSNNNNNNNKPTTAKPSSSSTTAPPTYKGTSFTPGRRPSAEWSSSITDTVERLGDQVWQSTAALLPSVFGRPPATGSAATSSAPRATVSGTPPLPTTTTSGKQGYAFKLDVMQKKDATYTTDPKETAEYEAFVKSLEAMDPAEWMAELSKAMGIHPAVKSAYEQLVVSASLLTPPVFWSRYAFRKKQLDEEEQRRQKLVSRLQALEKESETPAEDDWDWDTPATPPTNDTPATPAATATVAAPVTAPATPSTSSTAAPESSPAPTPAQPPAPGPAPAPAPAPAADAPSDADATPSPSSAVAAAQARAAKIESMRRELLAEKARLEAEQQAVAAVREAAQKEAERVKQAQQEAERVKRQTAEAQAQAQAEAEAAQRDEQERVAAAQREEERLAAVKRDEERAARECAEALERARVAQAEAERLAQRAEQERAERQRIELQEQERAAAEEQARVQAAAAAAANKKQQEEAEAAAIKKKQEEEAKAAEAAEAAAKKEEEATQTAALAAAALAQQVVERESIASSPIHHEHEHEHDTDLDSSDPEAILVKAPAETNIKKPGSDDDWDSWE